MMYGNTLRLSMTVMDDGNLLIHMYWILYVFNLVDFKRCHQSSVSHIHFSVTNNNIIRDYVVWDYAINTFCE